MPTRGGKILHWGSVTTGEWKKKQRSDEGDNFYADERLRG